MYLFLIFATPLAFLFLYLRHYAPDERHDTRRAVLRGLLLSLPVYAIALALEALVEPAWGSPLSFFHFWLGRILPPALLPILGYPLLYHANERTAPEKLLRRLTALYAGVLSPFGLIETLRLWGSPDAYGLFLLPFTWMAILLALPLLAEVYREGYGFGRVGILTGAILASLAAAMEPWLFLADLWWLALALALLFTVVAAFLAWPRLAARPKNREAAAGA